jgi:hypothetical protein
MTAANVIGEIRCDNRGERWELVRDNGSVLTIRSLEFVAMRTVTPAAWVKAYVWHRA